MKDDSPTLERLIDFHVKANIGVFFSRVVDLGGGLQYAMGAPGIDDYYWNYGYLRAGDTPSPEQVAVLTDHATEHSLTPTLWSTSSSAAGPEFGAWELVSTESWMTRDLHKLPPRASVGHDGVEIEVLDNPDDDMCRVFASAYGEESGDDAGYSGLPPAYTDAYLSQLPEDPARAIHSKVTVRGECCAIASALVLDDIVGIYSVGTSPSARRRGFGSLATEAVIEAAHAASRGRAQTALLQTEADSIVETMYKKMGFVRQFLGTLRVESRDE